VLGLDLVFSSAVFAENAIDVMLMDDHYLWIYCWRLSFTPYIYDQASDRM